MEKSPYSVSIHGTVHGWSIRIVAVYMYGVKLLTNDLGECPLSRPLNKGRPYYSTRSLVEALVM